MGLKQRKVENVDGDIERVGGYRVHLTKAYYFRINNL